MSPSLLLALHIADYTRRTKEHLNRSIQTGGAAVGHSSIEDSVATLDLVKWFVRSGRAKPSSTPPPPDASGREPFIARARAMGIVVREAPDKKDGARGVAKSV